ncbi:MAG TPA: SgcJ/EcaC family oxidoreductase [Gemmatimonadaceae bacterium]|nr:SgcJ/EcaC family oxidoreductase [Gemmatimonadaceae bacterium]
MRKSLLLSLLVAAAACSMGKKAPSDSTSMAAGDSSKAAMPADDNSARDAVAKTRSAWKDGADKKDSAGVAALYTDDAVLEGTDIPPAHGKAEIQKRLGQMFAVSSIGSIDSKQTSVAGNVAYDYGSFSQTVTPPKGKPIQMTGDYLVTLTKQADGSWKISHHMSNVQPATK